MRFSFVITMVAIVILGFPASTFAAAGTCSPIDAGKPAAKVCVTIVSEGLCKANPDCVWDLTGEAAEDPINGKDIIKLQNPLSTTDIPTIAGKAISTAMGVMGSLALIVFLYGGFRWLTAGGNSESIEAGTSAMIWATVGIFIIFASYAILQLVFETIGANQNQKLKATPEPGAETKYCLVNCTAAEVCKDITKAVSEDLGKAGISCTDTKFKIESKACADVAACAK